MPGPSPCASSTATARLFARMCGPLAEPEPNWDSFVLSPRFEGPASGTEEFLGLERELAVGVLADPSICVWRRALTRAPRDELPRRLRRSRCSQSLRRCDDGSGDSVPVRGADIDIRGYVWVRPS